MRHWIGLIKTAEWRLSRQQERHTFAHYNPAESAQRSTVIFTAVFVEASSNDSDLHLPILIMLIKKAKLHLPRQQHRSASVHHQRADARTSMPDIQELSEQPGLWSQALRSLQRAELKAWNAATSSNPQLVETFSASGCRNDVIGCRSPPPTHGHPSLGAKAPVFVVLLCSSPTTLTRQPARSSSTPHKPSTPLHSCRTSAAPAFAAADARISSFFNRCAGITLVHATALARLQDAVMVVELSNGDDIELAIPVVALLAQEHGELNEYLRLRLLALGLDLHNQQFQCSYVCFHHLRATSIRGFGKNVLAALEVAPPLTVPTLDLFIAKMAAYTEQDEFERLNAITHPCAEHANQDEQDMLNALTQSFTDEVEQAGVKEDSVCIPTQPGERHRPQLLGPSEFGFVLRKGENQYSRSSWKPSRSQKQQTTTHIWAQALQMLL